MFKLPNFYRAYHIILSRVPMMPIMIAFIRIIDDVTGLVIRKKEKKREKGSFENL